MVGQLKPQQIRNMLLRATELKDNRYFNRAYTDLPGLQANCSDGGLVDISVVVTLYNYQQYISSCLESALTSAREARPLVVEIIIIDDASTDLSRLLVRHLIMQVKDIPMLLVGRRLNTGLSAARNAGTRLARGTYVFMLDSDNLILPSCLRKLHSMAIDENLDAAYPIIVSVKTEESQSCGLISQYDFSLMHLFRENYIDAMALFNRETLMNLLEGYDENMQHGWEDYDLWLRLGITDKRVSCAFEILALYRVHGESMLKDTNKRRLQIAAYLYSKFIHFLPADQSSLFFSSQEEIRLYIDSCRHANNRDDGGEPNGWTDDTSHTYDINISRREIEGLEVANTHLRRENSELRAYIDELRRSGSWKVTAPIRQLGKFPGFISRLVTGRRQA